MESASTEIQFNALLGRVSTTIHYLFQKAIFVASQYQE